MSTISVTEEPSRLIVEPRRARRGAVIAECLAMTGLSCAILACGCEVGFYSNQRTFDVQSQRFAEAAIAQDQKPTGLSGVPKGCFGQARLELFNPTGFVFANYVCEVETKDGLIAANLGMRRDPDTWRMTSLYVDEPARSQRTVQASRLLVPTRPDDSFSISAGLHTHTGLARDWREMADRTKGVITAGAALDAAIGAN